MLPDTVVHDSGFLLPRALSSRPRVLGRVQTVTIPLDSSRNLTRSVKYPVGRCFGSFNICSENENSPNVTDEN